MKLLLAVDGSSQSRDAVQALAHFAPPEELTLVHALFLPDCDHPMITIDVRNEVMKDMENRLRHEGETLLSNTLSELPQDYESPYQIHQIGSPAQVILDTAQSAHSGLIILGARGLGSFKELVLGSVSHRVILHAPCPVLVTKRPLPSLQKILLPVEGKEDAEIAFTFLAGKPFRNPVEIQLMTVWPQPQVPWPITLGQSQLLEERALEHAQEQLDTFVSKLTTLGYHTTSYVGIGDPAYAIVEQQKANKADMIMMGTHGRKGISGFLIGSISHSVLHQAECPVLIFR